MTRHFAIVLLALAGLACRTGEQTGPHGFLTSIYVLRSVDGVALPTAGNGNSMTDFTLIADTIRVYENGFGVEVLVTSRPGVAGVQRQEQALQLSYDKGFVAFDVEYPCKDVLATSAASCIAPPHHRGVRSSFDMTFTYSVMYRVPLVFERVGPILPE